MPIISKPLGLPADKAYLDQIQDPQLTLGGVDAKDEVKCRIMSVDELEVWASNQRTALYRSNVVTNDQRQNLRRKNDGDKREATLLHQLQPRDQSPSDKGWTSLKSFTIHNHTQEIADGVISLWDQMKGFSDDLLLFRLGVPGKEFREPRLPVIVKHESRFNHRCDQKETRRNESFWN